MKLFQMVTVFLFISLIQEIVQITEKNNTDAVKICNFMSG